MAEQIELTEKAGVVLEYLQGQEEPLTGRDVAEAVDLNPQGIHGVLNSLVKKGLVEKADPVTMTVVNKKGLEEQRSYVTYRVTASGADFELDA
ncbi:MAG: MarR family transcriptional regulator [archaeon]